MKILFSITYFDPYVSGLTIYVSRLSRALAKKGHEVSVLCMQHDPKLPCKETRQDGVRIYRAKPIMALSKGFLSIQWLLHSWRLVKEADVVLVNLPQFEGVIPVVFGVLMMKKVISIYHCEILLSNTFIDQIIQSLVEVSNMVSLLLSDTVVTYTEDFVKHSKLLRFVKNKVQTIYPPIVPPRIDQSVRKRLQKLIYSSSDESPRSREGASGKFSPPVGGSNNTLIIGVSARLSREKGIEYLLEAIPLIKSILSSSRRRGSDSRLPASSAGGRGNDDNGRLKIVVAGPMTPAGEEEYKQKILRLVKQYKDQVVFLGSLSQREIGAFYSLLDVLVLPSINSTEAFGMVQVEAMYCGVPVVATNLPGVRVPIVRTGMGIVVPIKNSKKLADAIVEIVNNKERYIKPMASIDEEFSVKKTIHFFQKAIKEK